MGKKSCSSPFPAGPRFARSSLAALAAATALAKAHDFGESILVSPSPELGGVESVAFCSGGSDEKLGVEEDDAGVTPLAVPAGVVLFALAFERAAMGLLGQLAVEGDASSCDLR